MKNLKMKKEFKVIADLLSKKPLAFNSSLFGKSEIKMVSLVGVE